jgi:hypothetical protein
MIIIIRHSRHLRPPNALFEDISSWWLWSSSDILDTYGNPMPYLKIYRHDDDQNHHHQTFLTPTATQCLTWRYIVMRIMMMIIRHSWHLRPPNTLLEYISSWWLWSSSGILDTYGHPTPYLKIYRHDDYDDHHQTLLTPTATFLAGRAVTLPAHLHPTPWCGAVFLLSCTPLWRSQVKPLLCTWRTLKCSKPNPDWQTPDRRADRGRQVSKFQL